MKFSHLDDVEESYFSHMFFSFKLFFMLSILACVAFFHAIFPFAMSDTVSSKIENIQDALSSRG
tara:strand:- start:556 stop:747 length:192 start_codon:yes stop_codon:yes gene_type:complete